VFVVSLRCTQSCATRPLRKPAASLYASSHEVIVNLIANTTTTAGLKVRYQLDNNEYPTGVRVSDAELNTVHLERLRVPW